MPSLWDPVLRHVLVVEHDDGVRRKECAYLREHGLTVAEAATISSGRALLEANRFDVIVLDVDAEAGDGMNLLRDLAAAGFPPVILTSADKGEADRVVGLELGADDYLSKSVALRELLARLRAVYRRFQNSRVLPRQRIAIFDRWRADISAHRLTGPEGQVVVLTSGEIGVLRVLLEHSGQVLRRQDFLSLTRQDDAEVFERTVDVLITRLRRKIEADPKHPSVICTIRGEGYQLACEVRWEIVADEHPLRLVPPPRHEADDRANPKPGLVE